MSLIVSAGEDEPERAIRPHLSELMAGKGVSEAEGLRSRQGERGARLDGADHAAGCAAAPPPGLLAGEDEKRTLGRAWERLQFLLAGWSHRATMPRGAVRPAAGRSWLTWGRSLWLWLVGRALAGGCGHGADGQRRDGRNFVVMAMAGSGWSPGEGRRRWRGACFPATSSPGCRRARRRARSRWRKERGRLVPGSGRRTRWRRQGCGGRVARHVTAPRSRLGISYSDSVTTDRIFTYGL